jgi:hypothetical protein
MDGRSTFERDLGGLSGTAQGIWDLGRWGMDRAFPPGDGGMGSTFGTGEARANFNNRWPGSDETFIGWNPMNTDQVSQDTLTDSDRWAGRATDEAHNRNLFHGWGRGPFVGAGGADSRFGFGGDQNESGVASLPVTPAGWGRDFGSNMDEFNSGNRGNFADWGSRSPGTSWLSLPNRDGGDENWGFGGRQTESGVSHLPVTPAGWGRDFGSDMDEFDSGSRRFVRSSEARDTDNLFGGVSRYDGQPLPHSSFDESFNPSSEFPYRAANEAFYRGGGDFGGDNFRDRFGGGWENAVAPGAVSGGWNRTPGYSGLDPVESLPQGDYLPNFRGTFGDFPAQSGDANFADRFHFGGGRADFSNNGFVAPQLDNNTAFGGRNYNDGDNFPNPATGSFQNYNERFNVTDLHGSSGNDWLRGDGSSNGYSPSTSRLGLPDYGDPWEGMPSYDHTLGNNYYPDANFPQGAESVSGGSYGFSIDNPVPTPPGGYGSMVPTVVDNIYARNVAAGEQALRAAPAGYHHTSGGNLLPNPSGLPSYITSPAPTPVANPFINNAFPNTPFIPSGYY